MMITSEKKKKTDRRILYGFLAIIWMIVIFIYSAQSGISSGNTSSDVTYFILNALTQIGLISACNFTPHEIMQAEGIIRTIAHFIEYFILGIIVFMFIMYTAGKKTYTRILYTFIICGVYALTDEIHQYFVPGRAMQLSDWLTDAAGILSGIIIMIIITRHGLTKDN